MNYRHLLQLLIFSFAALTSFFVFAADPVTCLQGSPKKLQFHNFVNQKTSANDPRLIAHFQRSLRATAQRIKDSNYVGGLSCYKDGIVFSKQLLHLEQVAQSTNPLQIDPHCAYSAIERDNSRMTYMCTPGKKNTYKKEPLGNPGDKGPCISTDVASYVSWSLNEGIACLSPPDNPIDPILVYKKINNETGFNFGISWDGGKGIGQLTSTAIEDLQQTGPRRINYIDQVINSNNPHCQAFKSALLHEPEGTKNPCDWIEPSEGFARNIIYSLAYHLLLRDFYLRYGEFHMERKLKAAGITNPAYTNLIALAAYGKDGKKDFPKLLQAAKNNPTDYESFLQEAKKSSVYIRNTEDKYQEAVKAGATKQSCLVKPKKNGAK